LPRLERELNDSTDANLLDRVALEDGHALDKAGAKLAGVLLAGAPETALIGTAPSGLQQRTPDEQQHGRADVEQEVDLWQAVVRDGRLGEDDVPD